MSQFSVSVVIPAFNAERYLVEALESVRCQGYEPLETILVDDGSEDGTVAVAESFGRVKVIRVRHGGIGAARNVGLAAASGDLIGLLDADDVWPAGRLQTLADALFLGCGAAFGSVVEFGEGRAETPPTPGVLAGCTLIRREWFDRVGPFDETLRVGEFVDWWSRALDAGLRPVSIPDVVLRRRIHDRNTGVTSGQDARVDYARVLRAALQRRRSSS